MRLPRFEVTLARPSRLTNGFASLSCEALILRELQSVGSSWLRPHLPSFFDAFVDRMDRRSLRSPVPLLTWMGPCTSPVLSRHESGATCQEQAQLIRHVRPAEGLAAPRLSFWREDADGGGVRGGSLGEAGHTTRVWLAR